MSDLKYNKILLKISGEALLGSQDFGIDPEPFHFIANEIKKACNNNCKLFDFTQLTLNSLLFKLTGTG